MTTTLDQPRKTWRDRVFNRPTRPYIHPYLGGLLLGIVLFLAFFITGNGLGASGGLNRIVVFVQDIFAPEHVDRIPYLLKMAGGALNPLDDWVVPLVVGTIIGGFVSGWFSGRLQVETNRGPQHQQAHPLGNRAAGRRDHGLRRTHGARLHVRPGAVGRRGAVGRLVGLHVRRLRRRLRAGLLRAQTVELGDDHAISPTA